MLLPLFIAFLLAGLAFAVYQDLRIRRHIQKGELDKNGLTPAKEQAKIATQNIEKDLQSAPLSHKGRQQSSMPAHPSQEDPEPIFQESPQGQFLVDSSIFTSESGQRINLN